MQVWTLTLFLGTSLLLLIPGVALWHLLFPDENVFEQCAWGSATGLALAVYAAFVVAYWRISFFWLIWIVVAASILAIAAKRRLQYRSDAPRAGATKWVFAILVLVAISRFAPTFLHEWPLGWDPTFHLILAKKIALANGIIYDWAPFENVPLNYPLGSHFLIVALSRLSHLPLHRVFQMLIPLVGVLTTAEIYALSRRILRSEEVAILAAVAYGFWAGYGSIDYYRWGGLPNALAMSFVLAVIRLLVVPEPNWAHRLLFGLFFAAICFTHHHVMVTAGIALVVLFLYFPLTRQRREAVMIVSGLATAGVMGAFYLVPYALKAASLRSTNVFRFSEGPFTPSGIANDLGLVLVLCGSLGIFLAWRARKDCPGIALLFVISIVLVALFVACGPIYRWLSLRLTGQDYVAFTPSRFLTDFAPVLSVFAGYGAHYLWKRSRTPFGTAVTVGILLGLSNFWLWRDVFHESGPQPESWQAFQWIAEHTPENAIVLNGDPWGPYGTWRRTLVSPLPISEPVQLTAKDEALRQKLRSGPVPDQALQFELVKVTPPGDRGKVLWRDTNGWAVVEINAARQGR